MALVKIKTTRMTEAFIAEEPIANLAVICISTGGRGIKIAQSTNQELVGGVAIGAALSGQLARVVTHGVVSGVLTGAIVSAGDRVTSLTSGRIQPLNTITPAGTISQVSGKVTLVTGTISQVSGLISPVTGTISRVSGLINSVTGTVSQVSGLISVVSGSISQVSGFINLISGVGAAGGVGVDGTALSNISGAPLADLAGFVGAIPAFIGVSPEFTGAVPTFTGGAPVFSGAIPTFTGDALVFSGAIPIFTGDTQIFSGAVPILTGTAWNTARILGKALDNVASGLGCRVLVTIGG